MNSSYKARRKRERQARAEKTTHLMSEPAPVVLLRKEASQPERVPFRTGPGTVREIRVSVLEADLVGWAAKLDLTVPELVEIIRVRRFTPPPPPALKPARSPSWYLSDLYGGQYQGEL